MFLPWIVFCLNKNLMKNAADSDFQICLPGSGCGCFQSMSDATSGSFNISLQLSQGILIGIKQDGKREK